MEFFSYLGDSGITISAIPCGIYDIRSREYRSMLEMGFKEDSDATGEPAVLSSANYRKAICLTVKFNEAAAKRKFDSCLASINDIALSNDLQIEPFPPVVQRVRIDEYEEEEEDEEDGIFGWLQQLSRVTCYFDHEPRCRELDCQSQFETQVNYQDVKIVIKCHADTPFYNQLLELVIMN